MKKVILILWVIICLSGCATPSNVLIKKSDNDPRQITGRTLIDPVSKRVYVPEYVEDNLYEIHERIDAYNLNIYRKE